MALDPIKQKPLIDQKQMETASVAGAVNNFAPKADFNIFSAAKNDGSDPMSANANGKKPADTPSSSSLGQGAGMINITSNGTYGVGKSTGVSNQPDSPSATAYQRQGAGGSLFGTGFADSADNDPTTKMKKLNLNI